MGTYQIEWKPSALRELRRIDRQMVHRIISAIDSLSSNPLPSGVKKLHGGDSTYRIRVGDYRVVFEVFADRLVIVVIRVRHRKDVYR